MAKTNRTLDQPARATKSRVQNTEQSAPEATSRAIEDDSGGNENEIDKDISARERAQAMRRAPGHKLIFTRLSIVILFEIAGYLAPWDLMQLSQTTNALCKAFYSPKASSIWKAARKAVGAPDCSPGYPEPQWAFLLFGRPICQKCGTSSIHNVDFSIRRRICRGCKRQNLVSAVNFKKVFQHYDESVMDMIPYTRAGGWARVRTQTPGKFFWKSDVERIASEWIALQMDVRLHFRNAEENAAVYKMKQIDDAERIAEHAEVCDEWARRFNAELREKRRKSRV